MLGIVVASNPDPSMCLRARLKPRQGRYSGNRKRRSGDFGEKPAKLRPVGLGSARHFAEHFARVGLAKLAHLGLKALAIR
jgi:hypothetical protein